MAERNQKVFDRVRQELTKNTNLGSRDLYEIAKKVDDSISGDTLQQFHARYVLPLRREQAGRPGGRSAGTGAAKKTRRTTRRKAGEETARPVKQRRVSKALRSAQAATQERQKTRAVLLRFAQEFATAETKAEIIKVMGRLEDYVDQLVSGSEGN